MTTTDGALALNALILLIGLPIFWRAWRVMSRVDSSLTKLETVVLGMASDLGLVGRVEGVASRVHRLETLTTALAVHAGIQFPKE